MRRVPILVALAVTCLVGRVQAAPFASCTAESFTTGGLARGEGEGVWVPSDFRVAFNCAALEGGSPDPAPVYALFNTLFGFESRFPLPPGRFEIDAERGRPLYQFVPDRPEAFGQWWRTQVQASPQGGIPEPNTTLLLAGGLLMLGACRRRPARNRIEAAAK